MDRIFSILQANECTIKPATVGNDFGYQGLIEVDRYISERFGLPCYPSVPCRNHLVWLGAGNNLLLDPSGRDVSV